MGRNENGNRKSASCLAYWVPSCICFALAIAGSATARMYVGVALGANSSGDVVLKSRSNDRASICDEFINPRAGQISACTTSDRGVGDGWRAPFDPGVGFSGEVEIGFRMSPKLRVAALYARETTDFNQTVSSTDATGVDFDKLSSELSIGQETLGSAISDELRLVVYHDWSNHSDWTPYAGIGIAGSRIQKDFSWIWARNTDPAEIATGGDQPNSEEIRRNLAGTVSTGRTWLRDVVMGYVLVAGVERELADNLTVGVKATWKRLDTFESDAHTGELLRSHPSYLRLNGAEPVSAWTRSDDTGRFSTVLTIRFTVP